MTNPYNRVGLKKLALVALLSAGATAAQAALPYVAANVLNTQGTYTDLGTTGTAIATANTDDANSAAQSIGFTFNYNGTAYNQFVLNTNGYIKLGATAPATPYFNDGGQSTTGGPIDGADTDLLLPFNGDLTAGTAGGTEYRMVVSGTAPSRVLTIQWKNVSDKARAATATSAAVGTQYANFSFQVKLYEANSQIDFVYGSATAGAAANDLAKFMNVGIKGSSSADAILGVKVSSQPWSGTAFSAGAYTGNAHNVRVTVLPTAGRTYSFTLPVANDAAVQMIYGYGKLLVPAGQPATLQALVRNAGTATLTNLNVSLAISGANTVPATTQVVPSLAAGATAVVSFPGITLANTGSNTITVSVPTDTNSGNDTQTLDMATDATTTSYIYPGIPQTSSYGFQPSTTAAFTSAFGAKFTLNSPRAAVGVNATIGADPNLVGSTVFGVVADITTGAILARSADYVLTAADLGVLHSFTLSSQAQLQAGDYLMGLAQVVPANSTQVYPAAYQAENPARDATFFTFGVSTTSAPRDITTNNARYMLEVVTAAPATCPPPTSITATALSATSASVAFTGPSNGTGYTIVYGTPGFSPTTGGTSTPVFTTSPYTITGLTASTCYDVYVRADCGSTDQSTFAGPISVCTPCTPPTIVTFPYTQDFNTIATGQALPCGITVNDANADANTWNALSTVPTATNPALPIGNGGTGNAMVYFYNTTNSTIGGDDWFFTPALRLTAGRAYRLTFSYRSAGSAYPEGLEVKYGTANTPAGQTTTIYTNTNIVNPAYAAATGITDIAPATTGIYYIGFHATSAADQFFLAVDDVVVNEIILATSPALTKAVSVYPNPSNTGQFSLEVRGANAAQGLGVEVTNILGQTVYSGKAKDNFTNSLDLSSLAAGIYTLKVKKGSEYSVQQISIVK